MAPRLRVVLNELTEPDAGDPALTRADALQSGGAQPSAAALGSNAASFENLYEQHFEFTWRVLRHLGLGGASLNDGCQELWLVVHRRLPTIALHAQVRTWLFGVAVNVVRNQRRSAARHRCDPALPASLAAPGLDPIYPPKSIVVSYSSGAGVAFKGRVAEHLPAGALDTIQQRTSTFAPQSFRSEQRHVIEIPEFMVGSETVTIQVRPVLR